MESCGGRAEERLRQTHHLRRNSGAPLVPPIECPHLTSPLNAGVHVTINQSNCYAGPLLDVFALQFVIEGGRHPVVEAMMTTGEYVPNDLTLAAPSNPILSDCKALVITGPNMGGKTYVSRLFRIALS